MDFEEMLEMGFSFNNVDFTPDPVREEPTYPKSRHERYMDHINEVASMLGDGFGWGGGSLPIDKAMKLYPYEDWPY